MKKLLYTTSALVGAAFLMEAVVPAKAEVNMSLRYRAALISKSIKDEDKSDLEEDGAKHRSLKLNSSKINIDISASKDHPNGLTTGASIAIATQNAKGKADKKNNSDRLDYDNAIGYVSGSFGKIEVGDFHDVGYRAMSSGVPGTANFGAVDAGFQPAGVAIITPATGNIGGRGSSLAYWSPSFSGAQVSVSWSPQVAKEGRGAVSHTSAHDDVEDSLGLAATYSGAFGGTGVSMGVSFENAKQISKKVTNYLGKYDKEGTATNTVETSIFSVDADDRSDQVLYLFEDGAPKFAVASDAQAANADFGFSTKKQDPTAFAGFISFDIDNFTVGGSYGSWESPNSSTGSTVSESTAYALGASYSVDAITFGVGYATQSTDNVHHNIRVADSDGFTAGGATLAQIQKTSAFKQTLDSNILAFTTSYVLGDGASLDFVIEQSSAEEMHLSGTGSSVKLGKREVKTSGFGLGIDLKF